MKSGRTAALESDSATENQESGAVAEVQVDKPPVDRPSDKRRDGERASAIMRNVQADEERSLRDILDEIGPQGAYKLSVHRIEPDIVRVAGRDYNTKGHLKTYDGPLGEEIEAILAKKHGGGKYNIRILRQNDKGSFTYWKHRVIEVAGDPKIDHLPENAQQPASTAGAPGDPPAGIVKEVLRVMEGQLERAQSATSPGMDPAVQLLIEQMRESSRTQVEALSRQIEALNQQLTSAREHQPPPDPLKDMFLRSAIDSQTNREASLIARHDSEIRQLKDGFSETERRLRDQFDRDLASVKQGYERQIDAIRQSHQIALESAKASWELQGRILQNDLARMQRENDKLDVELRDLRSKKDKTLIEQAEEIRKVKDALGGDEEGDKSWVDKAIELASSPMAGEIVQRLGIGAKAPAAATQVQPKIQMVTAPDGQRFFQKPDGTLIPAKRKAKPAPAPTEQPAVNPDGTPAPPPIEMPQVAPELIQQVVGYLERAFSANQQPEVVAQSGRTVVPDEILTWIRDHDTGETSGVDLFMARVAKLPSTSPLSTQGGRNWVRKVGRALIGSE